MLNLLLVGFTEQNANVIQLFIEMTFEDIQVSRVQKSFEGTTAKLSELSEAEKSNDIFLLDAESLGINPEQPLTKYQELNGLLPNKTLLLITRQAVTDDIIDTAPVNLQWLSVPYTRKQMEEKLQHAINHANLEPSSKDFSSHIANAPLNVLAEKDQIATVTTKEIQHDNKTVKRIGQQDIHTMDATFGLLVKTFDGLGESDFFVFVRTLLSIKDYTLIDINGYHLYINPFDKSCVSSRVERIIDYFMIGQNIFQSFANRQVLSVGEYEQQTAEHLAQNSKKLTLNQLIWQIGLEMIPRNKYYEMHPLAIEVRFMPNLAGINFVPNYVMPLIASALGRVKTITDFNQLFPNLTNAQVNQVIILLIMSNSVNTDVLLSNQTANLAQQKIKPLDNNANQTKKETPVNNEGVQKAQQTGFLKRLLGRLGAKKA